MNLRVIDFDLLTRSFQPYVDGYFKIEDKKRELIESIEPLKDEMKSLISTSSSGIIIDDMTQKMNVERVKAIQQELMKYDYEFKTTLNKMRDDLNILVFDQLSEIISDWSKENSIDLVVGKMEVVYVTEAYDATSSIIEEVKKRDLYHEPQPQPVE